jgi:hypothetical protein
MGDLSTDELVQKIGESSAAANRLILMFHIRDLEKRLERERVSD